MKYIINKKINIEQKYLMSKIECNAYKQLVFKSIFNLLKSIGIYERSHCFIDIDTVSDL